MNLEQFLDHFHEKPVGWIIFYKSDGEIYKITFNKDVAERCKNCEQYVVMNLYR